jgi:hypothetical protein
VGTGATSATSHRHIWPSQNMPNLRLYGPGLEHSRYLGVPLLQRYRHFDAKCHLDKKTSNGRFLQTRLVYAQPLEGPLCLD